MLLVPEGVVQSEAFRTVDGWEKLVQSCVMFLRIMNTTLATRKKGNILTVCTQSTVLKWFLIFISF